MTRRAFLKYGPAAAAGLGLASHATAKASSPGRAKRPNIVYVFSDEHRWQSLPFTQMPEVHAPNMTRLAQQGTRFDNCCSTSPVCVPYRGVLLTGQWPHQSGIISNDTFLDGTIIGQRAPTIAHMFGEAGYRTGYVGKWHLQNETCEHAGFDYFKHWLYGDNHWETEVRDIPSGEAFKTVRGYNATGMTDQAIDFLKLNAGGEHPFLLMLSLNPPHWRWDDSPEEFYNLYPDENLPYRPNVEERQKSGKYHEFYRHYHGHISAVDHELGRMMEAIDQAGIAGDTILIYTSDHGSSFGSNGVYNKGNPYEESVRVPFIVRWPGKIPSGRIAEHNIGTIDLVPTLCGLAGFKAPEPCHGVDFSRAFLGKPDAPDPETQFILINNFVRNYVYSRVKEDERSDFNPFRQVRGKRYSYAVDRFGDWFLYDFKADPYQMNNLAGDPEYAAIRDRMAAELEAWIERAENPFIPAEWRTVDTAERVRMQNEYYSLVGFRDEWDAQKAEWLDPYMARAGAGDTQQLRALGDEVMDIRWFGMWKALDYEITGRRRATSVPIEELQSRMDALREETRARLAKGAERILG